MAPPACIASWAVNGNRWVRYSVSGFYSDDCQRLPLSAKDCQSLHHLILDGVDRQSVSRSELLLSTQFGWAIAADPVQMESVRISVSVLFQWTVAACTDCRCFTLESIICLLAGDQFLSRLLRPGVEGREVLDSHLWLFVVLAACCAATTEHAIACQSMSSQRGAVCARQGTLEAKQMRNQITTSSFAKDQNACLQKGDHKLAAAFNWAKETGRSGALALKI